MLVCDYKQLERSSCNYKWQYLWLKRNAKEWLLVFVWVLYINWQPFLSKKKKQREVLSHFQRIFWSWKDLISRKSPYLTVPPQKSFVLIANSQDGRVTSAGIERTTHSPICYLEDFIVAFPAQWEGSGTHTPSAA